MHCCDLMDSVITVKCLKHNDEFDCPDVLIKYSGKFNEYGILIHDGGTSARRISFCPWCGCKLPNSMRDEWFVEIEKLGIDPWGDNIPKEYQSNEWYIEKNTLEIDV